MELYLHSLSVFMAWYLIKDRDNLIHTLSSPTRDGNQGSSVGVATDYAKDVLGSIPGGGKRFISFPVTMPAMVTTETGILGQRKFFLLG
jgi:hypothetical protein